jgi:hypothetical protein
MDPDNELFDAACELLDRARRLRVAAADPGAGPAVPATLGCLAAALEELAGACGGLDADLGATLRRAARRAEAARSRAAALR